MAVKRYSMENNKDDWQDLPVEDDWQDIPAIESSQEIEIPSGIMAPAVAYVAPELVRQAIISDPIANFAESMAFRAAGGTAAPTGIDLIKEQATSKGIGSAIPSAIVEPMVTPRNVGRVILDEKLLGIGGLGTESGNLSRATSAAIEASKPTNVLLQSLQSPISKEDIYARTSQILGAPNLDIAVPENKQILKALEKRKTDLIGFQLPIEAEEAKRQLQQSINYGSEKSAAKASVSKAQARATREEVERAADMVGRLEEFRSLKKKSGNIQVAKDLLESRIKPTNPNLITSATGFISDLITKRLPGVAAVGVDTAQKVAKSSFGRAIPMAAGGLIGLGVQAADEGLQSEPSGALPTEVDTLDRRDAPISDNTMADEGIKSTYWFEKGVRDPWEQVQRARLSSFKEGLPNEGKSQIPSRFATPEQTKRYEDTLKAKKAGTLKENYVEKFESTELADIQNFVNFLQGSDDKASQEYSRVLSQLQDKPEREKSATLFALNQNPLFRQLAKKFKGVE